MKKMTENKEKATSKFTKEEVEDLKEAFSLFDEDKSGAINANKIGMLLRTVGQFCTHEELREIISKAKEDHDLISFHQFLEIMEARATRPDLDKEIKDAFKIIDKGGDGFISLHELKEIMTKLGERLTDDELYEMMRMADKNGDGRIDFEEFQLMLLNSS